MHRCSNCGFKAEDAAFFRYEKGGLFDHPQKVCEACQPYKPSDWEARLSIRMMLAPLFLLLTLVSDHDHVLFVLIAAAMSWPTRGLRTLIHEAGHAFAARAVGHDIIRAEVGRGPMRKILRLGDLTFTIRRYAWLGGRVRHFDPRNRGNRAVAILITAAGPLANILTAGVSIAAGALIARAASGWEVRTLMDFAMFSAGHPPAWLDPAMTAAHILSAACVGFGVFNLFMGLFNLIPQRTGDDETVPSDGQRLLNLLGKATKPAAPPDVLHYVHVCALSDMERHEEVIALALDGWETSRLKHGLATSMMHNLSRGRGDQAVIDFYLAHQDELQGDPDKRCWIDVNVAWSALKLGDSSLAPLAAETAETAMQVVPDHPAALGTYGAWLISVGQAAEGLPLLIGAARTIDNNIDKADFCRFLARGWRAIGDTNRAETTEALAAYLTASSGRR